MILVEFDEFGDHEIGVSDRVLATAISKTLSDMGTIPWAFMYSIDSAGDSLSSPVSLSEALGALEMDGPVICEAFLDYSQNFEPKLSSKVLDDGRIVSPSIDDMFPFLPKKEYESNHF
jgi:hypothetical protein